MILKNENINETKNTFYNSDILIKNSTLKGKKIIYEKFFKFF